MSNQPTRNQCHNARISAASVWGIASAAAMLLSACGGGADVVVPVQPSAQGASGAPSAPSAPDIPIVQPAWASFGVLVAPGQASKVLTLDDGSCVAANGLEGPRLYKIRLTISGEGDVSLMAAAAVNGVAQEVLSLPAAQAAFKQINLNASGGALTRATYQMSGSNDRALILRTDSERSLIAYFSSTNIGGVIAGATAVSCTIEAITFADLAPQTAFTPSEQRFATRMLQGVNAVAPRDGEDFGFLEYLSSDGMFTWSPSPFSAPTSGYSLNLANGKISKGTRDALAPAGLLSSAPITTVSYSGLTDGEYSETAGDDGSKGISLSAGGLVLSLGRRDNTLRVFND